MEMQIIKQNENYLNKIEKILEKYSNINSDVEADNLKEIGKEIVNFEKSFLDKYTSFIQPKKEEIKKIDAVVKPIMKRFTEFKNNISRKILLYQNAKKLQAEKEKQKTIEETTRDLQSLSSVDKLLELQKNLDKINNVESKINEDDKKLIKTRTVIRVEIEDLEIVPKDFLKVEIDLAKIQAHFRATKSQIKGLKIWQEETAYL